MGTTCCGILAQANLPCPASVPMRRAWMCHSTAGSSLLTGECLLVQTARSSSRNRTGSASLGPSNASLIGLRQQPASSPRACIRQQGDGCRPTSLVPSHRGSRLSNILTRLPIADSVSQPQLPLVHPLSRPDAAWQNHLLPLQPSGTLEASDPKPSDSLRPSAPEPVQLASSLGYPDRQHWSSGHGVVSFPAAAGQGSLEDSEAAAESTQPGDQERQARRDQRAKQRQREVEISKLILEKVQQQHRYSWTSQPPGKLHDNRMGLKADLVPPWIEGSSRSCATDSHVWLACCNHSHRCWQKAGCWGAGRVHFIARGMFLCIL